MKQFSFHSDYGHGWLAVKRELLVKCGVQDRITSHSYQNGKTVYLEEDLDAGTFLKAYKEQFGEYTIKDLVQKKISPVRRYDHYTKNA